MKHTKRLAVLLSVLAAIVALWASAVTFEGDVAQGTPATMAATGDRPGAGQSVHSAPRSGVARFSTTDMAVP